MRLRRERGAASEQECVDCGGQARDWSYDHQDAEEVSGPDRAGRTVKYSLKLGHYQPRCKPCHSKFDQ
ncbi:hypothetical protein PV708_02485 [Streptomyces sp. ME02-6977A]|uniref:hypothetical protein n=1 Tax=Streptomyces sp. ME02-6977A TaxID=3028671 RepID=UPI0029ABA155|nr:hypothetical protein [Streptomyces sp. ME02-6977A]MDX3405116.1 hypothetical protein [Streptomyces sp. ME02-6977A]